MSDITYYTFQGVGQALKIAVFPSRQTIYLLSSKTNGKFVDVSGFGVGKFFDSEQEMNKCLAMTDEDFDATMIKTFVAQGYSFVKKEIVKDGS